jgi:carboxyl-terminal processing protease
MLKRGNIQKEKRNIKEIIFKRKNSKLRKTKLVGFKLIEVALLVSIATVIGVLSGSLLTYNLTSRNSNGGNINSKYINEFKEAYDDIINNYYENVDKNDLIDAAINGMTSILDDYTSYMTPEEAKNFNLRMEGEYEGIGIEFVTTVNNEHIITNVFEGTPAYEAGVKANDQITRIDNIDASTKTGIELASYIQSPSISEITLVVKRNNEDITLKIKKSSISIPSISKKTFDNNGKKVGYINISLFADNTYNQFKDALISLEQEGISSLVIDVRDNSGGYLHTADNILELFMTKGEVIYQVKDKNGAVKYEDGTDERRTYPVAILINGNSASASEILASAFKEVYNSEIIGTTSFGKGTVQQPSDLTNGGMIKVTTDEWLTPKGNIINKVGVKPTIEISLSTNYQNNPTDANDDQLQKAIEVLAK